MRALLKSHGKFEHDRKLEFRKSCKIIDSLKLLPYFASSVNESHL